jgi:hypothetical protein
VRLRTNEILKKTRRCPAVMLRWSNLMRRIKPPQSKINLGSSEDCLDWEGLNKQNYKKKLRKKRKKNHPIKRRRLKRSPKSLRIK